MVLELNPGTSIVLDGQVYHVEEHITYHDEDFRLDLVRITGATAAHERWLLSVQQEPYLMLLQRLEQEWLAPPTSSLVHDGEIFTAIYQGSAFRMRSSRTGRGRDGRTDYGIFRANSGRVILTLGQNDEIDAWIGATLPAEFVQLPGGSFSR